MPSIVSKRSSRSGRKRFGKGANLGSTIDRKPHRECR
jgi:hypothetical protein